MALKAGNPCLVADNNSPHFNWQAVDVNFADSAGVIATPDAVVEVAAGEGIEVLGTKILIAGTTNANLDIGILTAAGAEGDADGFCDGIDLDDAAGTLEAAAGAYTQVGGGIYWNVSGATQYLAITGETAAAAAGAIRIFYRTHCPPLASNLD